MPDLDANLVTKLNSDLKKIEIELVGMSNKARDKNEVFYSKALITPEDLAVLKDYFKVQTVELKKYENTISEIKASSDEAIRKIQNKDMVDSKIQKSVQNDRIQNILKNLSDEDRKLEAKFHSVNKHVLDVQSQVKRLESTFDGLVTTAESKCAKSMEMYNQQKKGEKIDSELSKVEKQINETKDDIKANLDNFVAKIAEQIKPIIAATTPSSWIGARRTGAKARIDIAKDLANKLPESIEAIKNELNKQTPNLEEAASKANLLIQIIAKANRNYNDKDVKKDDSKLNKIMIKMMESKDAYKSKPIEPSIQKITSLMEQKKTLIDEQKKILIEKKTGIEREPDSAPDTSRRRIR